MTTDFAQLLNDSKIIYYNSNTKSLLFLFYDYSTNMTGSTLLLQWITVGKCHLYSPNRHHKKLIMIVAEFWC